MKRVYNFSAGPAVLPEEVLKEVAAEMLDYNGTGMSVLEMSHRSPAFQAIVDEAEKDLRELMNIPENYRVLFLQGGAHLQFAMVPMNLMKNKVADYIVTGQWAKRAYEEASKYGKVNKIATSEDAHSHIFLIVLIFQSAKMQTMCIFAKITQFTVQNSKHYQILKENFWYQTFLPAFYLNP